MRLRETDKNLLGHKDRVFNQSKSHDNSTFFSLIVLQVRNTTQVMREFGETADLS